jgi:murein tripeptide amidase MpaA
MSEKKGPQIDFTTFVNHEELTNHLKALAEAYPELATLNSIGKSIQGRDLWMIEITNKAVGGAPEEKPGYYIDGITHPEEVSGAMVSLYTAWYLLTNYGTDPLVTRLLDWQVFYILPAVNPDGMEIALRGGFHEWIGNGRYMPGEEQFGPGLHYGDVNGDGLVMDMRIPDEDGEWKVSEKDPRLLIPRLPYEFGGEYYRMMPEGMIEDFDGVEIPIPRPMDGNLNRNYPYKWFPEYRQYGAGEYPMSEPEIEAVVKFLLKHNNIAGAINYHTNAGAVLLPFETGEGGMPYEDQVVFRMIGEMGAEMTGYGLIADESDFNLPNAKERTGTSTGVLYVQQGITALVTELWDVYKESGIEKESFFQHRPWSEDDMLKLLKFNDEKANGESFVDWTPFEHPQLGPVEIGGWKRMFMFRNPPAGEYLADMCHKNALFSLHHAALAPCVRLKDVTVTPVSDGVFKIEAVVANKGFLPTYVTRQAVHADAVEPVEAALELGDGVELVSGKLATELGQLAGRSERGMKYSRFREWHATAKKVEWVVRLIGADKGEVVVRSLSQRGGIDVQSLTLEPAA